MNASVLQKHNDIIYTHTFTYITGGMISRM